MISIDRQILFLVLSNYSTILIWFGVLNYGGVWPFFSGLFFRVNIPLMYGTVWYGVLFWIISFFGFTIIFHFRKNMVHARIFANMKT